MGTLAIGKMLRNASTILLLVMLISHCHHRHYRVQDPSSSLTEGYTLQHDKVSNDQRAATAGGPAHKAILAKLNNVV